MYRNRLLTLAVIAAAALAVLLAFRPRPVVPAPFDPTDSLLDTEFYSWTKAQPEVMTMDGAVADVSKATGIRIVLDWPELSAAGISRDSRLPTFSGPTVAVALKVLAQSYFGPPGRFVSGPPLRFARTADGSLFVSIDHDTKRVLRVYDVGDLLTDSYWGMPNDAKTAHDSQMNRRETLCNLLKSRTDANETYLGAGGYIFDADRVTVTGDKLLVFTRPANQRQIERVLASLRQMK